MIDMAHIYREGTMRKSEMKKVGHAVGVSGLLWLGYFWLAVLLYPHFRVAMPSLNAVVILTFASAAACAFAGAMVSRYWWTGVAASLLTLLIIKARIP